MYKGEERVAGLLADKKRASLEEIASALKLNMDSARKLVESLKAQDYISLEKQDKEKLSASNEFRSCLAAGALPEFSVFKKSLNGKKVADLDENEKKYGLGWAKRKGYVDIEAGVLKPLKEMKEVEAENDALLKLCLDVDAGKTVDSEIAEELFKRGLIEHKTESEFIATWLGKEMPKEAVFDVTTEGPDALIGKAHPLGVLSNRIKQIFVELGFEEMDGGIVESAFWNFDALFQPQDHPARDMADTFYLEGETDLPDKKIVERVKKSHEQGWGYRWSEQEAKRRILRTHTTALSARTLAKLGKGIPKKYFAIGRVFRNEATDSTHLAEFCQVEGIVVWEKATFRNLLGVLKEFYSRLGFEQIRFRPSFFPYTEPSLEIEVFLEKKGKWLEMGGAGIFRPEVSIPLANTYPVLAWGLSLERPLMLLSELGDIRTMYRNDMDFLKNTRI